MAKKVAISITIDRDVLRTLDNALRTRQSKELERGRVRSNRSKLVEEIVRGWSDGSS